MKIPKISKMNVYAIMQLYRQYNNYCDQELEETIKQKLFELPLNTQLEKLKTERNKGLKEILEISIAKKHLLATSLEQDQSENLLPFWYLENLISIDAANILTKAPQSSISQLANEKYIELLEKALDEFDGIEEIGFYEGKLGRVNVLDSTPIANDKSNKQSDKSNMCKIYQFKRRNE